MAHENSDQQNPIIALQLELPMAVAARWTAQPQYVISERMMSHLMDVLTEEQMAELIEKKVEFQPVVFPRAGVVVR